MSTPIIFILSVGADPMRYLLDLAREHEKLPSEFTPISLGEGMGKIAEEEMTKARMNGDWICL